MIIKRRLNYTGRKKIDRSMVKINLVDQKGKPPAFTAEFDSKPLSLPPEAKVYLEAYYTSSRQRFDFGEVGAFSPPEDTTITEVDTGGPILFRIKVVDNSSNEGRLLASAERLRPLNETEETDHEFLLKVTKRNLGSLPWKLELNEDDDEKPELMLNNSIPDALGQIKHNSLFQGLILPAVIREIYTFIFVTCGGQSEDGSWQQKWLAFGEQLSGSESPEPGDNEVVNSWIDQVIEKFCSVHDLITRLSSHLSEVTS